MLSPAIFGQNQLVGTQPPAPQPDTNGKRILWLIPNFRTTDELKNYQPISAAAKFKIARQDTFDRGTFALAGLFAGEAQLVNADRSFGQGVGGYARYFAASYADFAIGNYIRKACSLSCSIRTRAISDAATVASCPVSAIQPLRSCSLTGIRATPR